MKIFAIIVVAFLSTFILMTGKSIGQDYSKGNANYQSAVKAQKQNTQKLARVTNKVLNVAKFDSEENLIRPEGYREWVFAGSSLGLNYRQNLPEPNQPTQEFYHNTYIHPDAYREFSRTGKFPEGTVLVLEILTQEKKKEPGLQGSYGKEYVAVEASVKDSRRFKDGWAYFGFNGEDGKLLAKAKAFPTQSCFACHDKKAETDHVFTQFYSVLSAVKPK